MSQCPKPKRPAGACFRCNEVGHFHTNCPKKPRGAAMTGAEQNEPIMEEELQLAEQLAASKCCLYGEK